MPRHLEKRLSSVASWWFPGSSSTTKVLHLLLFVWPWECPQTSPTPPADLKQTTSWPHCNKNMLLMLCSNQNAPRLLFIFVKLFVRLLCYWERHKLDKVWLLPRQSWPTASCSVSTHPPDKLFWGATQQAATQYSSLSLPNFTSI